MKIDHIRPGRETNSSSSHCFVKAPTKMSIPQGETVEATWCGWSWEVLDANELMGYLLLQSLYNTISSIDGILSDFDVKLLLTSESDIDHASRFRLEGADYIVQSFMRDLVKVVYAENLTVATGNDNCETPADVMRLIGADEAYSNQGYNKYDLLFGTCYITQPRDNTYVILARDRLKDSGWSGWHEKTPILYDGWAKVRMKIVGEKEYAIYPESIDIKITERCDNDCPFCYENASKVGRHCGYLDFTKMIDEISGHTAEVALGGGNPLLHPHILDMLDHAIDCHVLPAITVRDTDMLVFLENTELTPQMERIFDCAAVGLSFSDLDTIEKVFELSNQWFRYKRISYTVHFINRVHVIEDVLQHTERNEWNDVLILGYKDCGRGATYKPEHGDMGAKTLLNLPDFYGNVMFDNLAVEQLEVRNHVSDSEWKMFFGGHDGEYTMAVDLVNMRFAKNSYASETHPFEDGVSKSFAELKEMRTCSN